MLIKLNVEINYAKHLHNASIYYTFVLRYQSKYIENYLSIKQKYKKRLKNGILKPNNMKSIYKQSLFEALTNSEAFKANEQEADIEVQEHNEIRAFQKNYESCKYGLFS